MESRRTWKPSSTTVDDILTISANNDLCQLGMGGCAFDGRLTDENKERLTDTTESTRFNSLNSLTPPPSCFSNAITPSPSFTRQFCGPWESLSSNSPPTVHSSGQSSPPGNATRPPSKPDSNAPLHDQVDQVERSLGLALKDYRQRAEDILDQHFEAMARAQAEKDHQVALLKAENHTLRTQLGLAVPESGSAQKILFQAASKDEPLSKRREAANRVHRSSSDEDSSRMNARRRNKVNSANASSQAAGGSWQQFVAWVPMGAALQDPEPWKPLPSGSTKPSMEQINPSAAVRRIRSECSNESQLVTAKQGQFAAIIPGAVDDVVTNKFNDDESQGSSKGGKEADDEMELFEIWMPNRRESQTLNNGESNGLLDNCDMQSGGSALISLMGDEFKDKLAKKKWYIINPDSNGRIGWDLASLVMVVYDMIVIPMAPFELDEHVFLATMDWTTRIFWTLDMAWSCFTGVVLDDGSVAYEPKFILKRYLKSWFSLDLFIVGSDWSGLMFSSGGMGLSKLARVSRVVRVIRLLRLVRMQEVIASIMERIQSDKMNLAMQVLKIMTFLMAICHMIACAWWAVGDRSTGADTWVVANGYKSASVSTQYLVSLHWSLSQFTGGLADIGPRSDSERLFAISAWVFAFMVGLVMLSFLTSTMTQQYIIGGSSARQMATLKNYLTQNKVPKNLTKRVCRNATHAISGDLTADAVDLLHVISEPLKVEMHFAMFSRIAIVHPFFQDIFAQSEVLVRRLCHSAMSMLLVMERDVVFSRDEEPVEQKMYFACKGVLEYADAYGEKTKLAENQWVAEAALWTQWRHRGTLTAITDAKLTMLDSQAFQDLCHVAMKKSKTISLMLKKYAQAYIHELNNRSSEITDLAMDCT